jgi:hypothetical protein
LVGWLGEPSKNPIGIAPPALVSAVMLACFRGSGSIARLTTIARDRPFCHGVKPQRVTPITLGLRTGKAGAIKSLPGSIRRVETMGGLPPRA